MKIALCVSGLLRDPIKSFENLINIVNRDKHHLDLFIHSWEPEETMKDDKWGINGGVGRKGYEKRNRNHFDIRGTSSEEIISHINSKIHPVADFLLEHQSEKQSEILEIQESFGGEYKKEWSPYNFSSFLYSLYKCNELKNTYVENHETEGGGYDLVIRGRTEITFRGSVSDELLEKTLHTIDALLLPAKGHFHGVNDMFAIGTAKTINHYCNIKNNIENLKQRNPHLMWNEHLQKHVKHFLLFRKPEFALRGGAPPSWTEFKCNGAKKTEV